MIQKVDIPWREKKYTPKQAAYHRLVTRRQIVSHLGYHPSIFGRWTRGFDDFPKPQGLLETGTYRGNHENMQQLFKWDEFRRWYTDKLEEKLINGPRGPKKT